MGTPGSESVMVCFQSVCLAQFQLWFFPVCTPGLDSVLVCFQSVRLAQEKEDVKPVKREHEDSEDDEEDEPLAAR